MAPIRLAVSGARGKMGRIVAEMALSDPRFELKKLLESPEHPERGSVVSVAGRGEFKIDSALDGAAEVVVDFSTPAGFRLRLLECVQARVAFVSGTTGLSKADEDLLIDASSEIPCMHSPNMSIGVELVSRAAADIAGRLPPDFDAEVSEIHHRMKADAPSGTALRIAKAIVEARPQASELVFGRQGRPGPRRPTEIGVLALRGGDVVGDHTVLFLGPGERIEITHRCTDRSVFARGALHAAAAIVRATPRLFRMADVLPGTR